MPSTSFHAQSGYQTWAVPQGVTRVTVDLQGGGSGATPGGRVQGVLKVHDTDVLYLLVGEAGKAASGRNGGGSANGGGGRGGDGSSGKNGGDGGGGAAAIRRNSADGSILAAAGGAGGRSGDGGAGGEGGGTQGEAGHLGGLYPILGVGAATGGDQYQGGNGGASTSSSGLSGGNAPNTGLGQGGAGGQRASVATQGGGGGGGGYRAGGGGAAAQVSVSAGGGGGGGSNYTGGLSVVTRTTQGGGGTGDAVVILAWDSPAPANQPPGVPSEIKVDGRAEATGMSTRSMGRVHISGLVRDSDSTTVAPTHVGGAATQVHQQVRLHIRYSAHKSFANSSVVRSDLVEDGKRAEVVLTGLHTAAHYYLRVYAEDAKGLVSDAYNAVDFWTNRPPTEPSLSGPADNGIINDFDTVTFTWTHNDPDDNDRQSGFVLRWRRAATATRTASDWVTHKRNVATSSYAADPNTFKAATRYEWTARTTDQQGVQGPYAPPRSFYVLGTTFPPRLDYPIRGQAVDVSEPVTLNWTFKDPSPGDHQTRADYRFRVVGTSLWVTRVGNVATPGSSTQWEVPVDTFAARQHYEWAVRTYDSTATLSDWSDAEHFWTHGAIGQTGNLPIDFTTSSGLLGNGRNRVFVYDRGGTVRRGEITPLTQVAWGRTRDDIDNCTIVTNGFDGQVADLLSNTHTWVHELVVFRDDGEKSSRVFEGPITRIGDSPSGFTIEAKDVMGYVYRRAMRNGFNDAYKVVNGVPEGLLSVVERASLIIRDALAPNDPNVLPYLTLLSFGDDARESRVVPDMTMSAWEEVDDMAANAGLDYSVVGRRIILNDTHRAVGRLAEWRSSYFSAAPEITEYGMLLADFYAVTSGTGLWGAAHAPDSPYGGVEIVVNSFSSVVTPGETMTKAKEQQIRQSLTEQARRGIASRYPAPLQVRVPDNSRLLPDVPVDINQLVPGAWVPLRAKGTLLEVSQWQKLDSVKVTEADGDEQVTVTLSPAPNSGQDPDADTTLTEVDT